jgi:hypothetical protein
VAAVLPLLPFLLDATFTLLTRVTKGEQFWRPHRSHFYQQLARQGVSHGAVTAIWGGLALLCAVVAVGYDAFGTRSQIAALVGLVIVHLVLALAIVVRSTKPHRPRRTGEALR